MLRLWYWLALAASFTRSVHGIPVKDISKDNPPHSGTACPQDTTISVTVNGDKLVLPQKIPRTCQPSFTAYVISFSIEANFGSFGVRTG